MAVGDVISMMYTYITIGIKGELLRFGVNFQDCWTRNSALILETKLI